MSYEEEVAALVIHKTEPDDADVYRCEVSNPLGRVQTEGTLSVHSELCFYQINGKKLKIKNLIYFFNAAGLYMVKDPLLVKNQHEKILAALAKFS